MKTILKRYVSEGIVILKIIIQLKIMFSYKIIKAKQLSLVFINAYEFFTSILFTYWTISFI